ncbi:MAG: T9SS type A sorting domain-containing protein [Crocinitomicaceae bacterium]|nr:T9SS type A sorting domain-containing protein [Crocinitomicaceae bacterium]
MTRSTLLAILLFSHAFLFSQSWQSIVTCSSPNQSNGISTKVYNNKVYYGGNFQGVLSIGFSSVTGLNGQDIFIGKANLSGFTEWILSIKGTSLDALSNIEVSGNQVIVSGQFTDSLFVGTDTLVNVNQNGAFIAFYDTLGNFVKSWQPDTYNADYMDFKFDSQGDLMITGEFRQYLNYGGFSMTVPSGGNFFLLKYSPSLDSILWGVYSQGDANYGIKLCIDGDDNTYVTGAYNDGTTFIDTLINTGNLNHNMFVSKIDTDGNHKWITTIEGTGEVHGYGIACDDSSNVFAVGEFEGVLDVQGNILNSNGSFDGIIIKYDSAGNYVWAESLGGVNSDEAYEVILDENLDPIVLLEAHSGAEYKGQVLNINGFDEPLIVKVKNADGSLIWDRSLHSTQTSGVVTSTSMGFAGNNLAITGANRTSIIMNSQTYSAPNNKDFFVAIMGDSLTYHLGVQEKENEIVTLIYPNPTNGILHFQSEYPIELIEIYDSRGNLLLSEDVKQLKVTTDLKDLSPGIYFCRILSKEKFKTHKIILTNY